MSTITESQRWSYELFDLSRPLTEETVFALLGDSVAGDEYRRYRSITVDHDQTWETSNSLVCHFGMSDHVGTHVDAPSHCLEDGVGVEGMDLSRLIGEAVVVDMRHADADHGYRGRDFAQTTPRIEPGDIVLIYSGYEDAARDRRIHQTFVTPDGAAWLVERGVHAVGCEPGGLEHCWDGVYEQRWDAKPTPNPPPWPAHRILLAADIYIIEGLTNLAQLVGQRVRFAALPLSIPGLSGSPVRAVAWRDASR